MVAGRVSRGGGRSAVLLFHFPQRTCGSFSMRAQDKHRRSTEPQRLPPRPRPTITHAQPLHPPLPSPKRGKRLHEPRKRFRRRSRRPECGSWLPWRPQRRTSGDTLGRENAVISAVLEAVGRDFRLRRSSAPEGARLPRMLWGEISGDALDCRRTACSAFLEVAARNFRRLFGSLENCMLGSPEKTQHEFLATL